MEAYNKQGVKVVCGTFKGEFIGHVVATRMELEQKIEKQSRRAARVAAKTLRAACRAGEARAMHHAQVMRNRKAEQLHHETAAQCKPAEPKLNS